MNQNFRFSKIFVDSDRFLIARYSMEYLLNLTGKKLSQDLVHSLFPDPLYRSLRSDKSGQDVLAGVPKMYMPPHVNTFLFKLHSGTLPVKVWMDKRVIYVPWTADCLLWKKREAIEHVFLCCWDACSCEMFLNVR